MARPDVVPGYGGWQAVDATPQERSKGKRDCEGGRRLLSNVPRLFRDRVLTAQAFSCRAITHLWFKEA